MFELIGVLFPSIIGTSIINKKIKLDVKLYLFFYSLLVILSNCSICLLFYVKTKVLFMDFTCLFFVKYCFLGVIFNVIISLIINWCKKNFKLKLRRKK
jgi:hypothetical protein